MVAADIDTAKQIPGIGKRLTMANASSSLKGSVLRALLLSHPQQYGSVRNDGKKIGMVAHPEEIDAGSRRLVGTELEHRYMVATVPDNISLRTWMTIGILY